MILLAVSFLLSPVSHAWSQTEPPSGEKNAVEDPWHITADTVDYDENAKQYIGKGNVVIVGQGRTIQADFVRFDKETMDAEAIGNVEITAGDDIMTGSRMEINLETETGTVYNGEVFVKESHFYIQGDAIEKLGKKTYASDRATITTCDGDRPAWKITARNVKVTVEGMGFADHATFWAKQIPLLYTPTIMFPVGRKRQTGLLMPQFSTGDRRGFEVAQPFFWAINDSSDASVYYRHIEKRGEKFGIEYRYLLSDASQGAFMFSGMKDRQVDDGTEKNANWGFQDDSATRTNKDRYWLRGKLDQELPWDFNLKMDLDIVSDQDYLLEFKRGYDAFDDSDNYFKKYFGRDLESYDDAYRRNRLLLNKTWSAYSFNAAFDYYDDVVNRRENEPNRVQQTLPEVTFNSSKQQIFGSIAYFDLESEYTRFYFEEIRKGHRLDIQPRFYLPVNYKHYFSFEPSAGVRETVWYQDRKYRYGEENEFQYRSLYDIGAELSSDIFRIFDVNIGPIEKIKHAIRPVVIYSYKPEVDQSEYPRFDSQDRISRQNQITYRLINTLTSKSRVRINSESSVKDNDHQKTTAPEAKAPTDNSDQDIPVEEAPDPYTYREFLRLELETTFDLFEAREDDSTNWNNPDRREPWGAIYAQVIFTPINYFYIRGELAHSPYESYFDYHNFAIRLRDPRGDHLYVEHRYTYDSSESIYTQSKIKVTDALSVYGDYERNILDEKDISLGLGFLYRSQCWSLNCKFINEDDANELVFMINLFGIGDIAKSFSLETDIDPIEYD